MTVWYKVRVEIHGFGLEYEQVIEVEVNMPGVEDSRYFEVRTMAIVH